MKFLDLWRQQELSPESRLRLRELIDLERYEPDDAARRDSLLDAFLATLTEAQLTVLARLVREMTTRVH